MAILLQSLASALLLLKAPSVEVQGKGIFALLKTPSTEMYGVSAQGVSPLGGIGRLIGDRTHITSMVASENGDLIGVGYPTADERDLVAAWRSSDCRRVFSAQSPVFSPIVDYVSTDGIYFHGAGADQAWDQEFYYRAAPSGKVTYVGCLRRGYMQLTSWSRDRLVVAVDIRRRSLHVVAFLPEKKAYLKVGDFVISKKGVRAQICPDGTSLLIQHGSDLFRYDLGGKGYKRRLLAKDVAEFCCSGDSSRIYLIKHSLREVYLLQPDTGALKQITSDGIPKHGLQPLAAVKAVLFQATPGRAEESGRPEIIFSSGKIWRSIPRKIDPGLALSFDSATPWG